MSLWGIAGQAYREGLPALGASVIGGLLAGVVLGGMRADLGRVDGLLVLVPALLATRGNVYGSLGARLATGLHQGLVEPQIGRDPRQYRAAAAALTNGLLASAFAALAAFLILGGLQEPVTALPILLAIALISGLLSGIVLSLSVIGIVVVGFRRGYNPDTLVGPIVTTTGDVFGMAFLLIAVRLIVSVAGGG